MKLNAYCVLYIHLLYLSYDRYHGSQLYYSKIRRIFQEISEYVLILIPNKHSQVSMNNLAECLLARGTKEDVEEANLIQLEIIRLCGGKPEDKVEDENEGENKNENENVIVTKNKNKNKDIDKNNNIDNNISTTIIDDESIVIDDSKAPLVNDDIEKNTKINDEKVLEDDNEKKISNIPINLNYSTRSRKSAK